MIQDPLSADRKHVLSLKYKEPHEGKAAIALKKIVVARALKRSRRAKRKKRNNISSILSFVEVILSLMWDIPKKDKLEENVGLGINQRKREEISNHR